MISIMRYHSMPEFCKNLISFIKKNRYLVNELNHNQKTPLSVAVLENNAQAVLDLLDLGANVSKLNEDGSTALTLAMSKKFNDIAELLINKILAEKTCRNERRFYFNQLTKNGDTLLNLAVLYHNDKILKILIENGADVNQPDSKGNTPLRTAMRQNNGDMVKFLIENGANVNKVDDSGQTPLIRAILQNNYDMVRILIENGANVNQRGKDKRAPLTIAGEERCEKIQELLKAKGATDINFFLPKPRLSFFQNISHYNEAPFLHSKFVKTNNDASSDKINYSANKH